MAVPTQVEGAVATRAADFVGSHVVDRLVGIERRNPTSDAPAAVNLTTDRGFPPPSSAVGSDLAAAIHRAVDVGLALFVLVPGLYALLLTILAEQWLRPDGGFLRAPRTTALAPLLLWIPLAPLFVLLAIGWLSARWIRRLPRIGPAVTRPLVGWVARGALTVVFVVSLVSLVREVSLIGTA